MVLDLVAEVSTQDSHEGAGVEVRGSEHLPQIPFRLRLVLHGFGSEFLCTVDEMTTHDHDVRPAVAETGGAHIRQKCSQKAPSAERREEEIVLGRLKTHLADHGAL